MVIDDENKAPGRCASGRGNCCTATGLHYLHDVTTSAGNKRKLDNERILRVEKEGSHDKSERLRRQIGEGSTRCVISRTIISWPSNNGFHFAEEIRKPDCNSSVSFTDWSNGKIFAEKVVGRKLTWTFPAHNPDVFCEYIYSLTWRYCKDQAQLGFLI